MNLWPLLMQHCRKHPLSASGFGVALFALLSIWLIDRPVAVYFKSTLGRDAERFYKTITVIGESTFYFVLAIILLALLRTAQGFALTTKTAALLHHWMRVCLYFLLSLTASSLTVSLLKFVFGRYRPRALFENDLYGFAWFDAGWLVNSFPSGHSQTIFAVAAALCFIVPRYDLMWLGFAALIAISRVTTTVHFVSDIAAGAWLGVAGAIWVQRAFAARHISVRFRIKHPEALP